MAYHYIQQGYFGDREYRQLSRDEGYFFEFLWQLPQLSCAGVGRITIAMLAAESYDKFSQDECRALLTALQARHRIIYDDEWLWVVNYFKYKPGGSQFVLLNARASLEACESKLIFDAWKKKYGGRENVIKIMGDMQFGGTSLDRTEEQAGVLEGIEGEPAEFHLHGAEVGVVWAHYQKRMGTERLLSPKARQKILERLRENIVENGVPRVVTSKDLMRAITNCSKSAWHMGRDPKTQGVAYNSLETHILGDQTKFLMWLTSDRQKATTTRLGETGEVVLREETPGISAKWRGERTPPEEVKAIIQRTVKALGGGDDGESKERVLRG